MIDPDAILKLPKLPNPDTHTCFGCSGRNPSGLKMEFHSDGAAVYSVLSIPPHLCGWNDLAHGGVVSTVLDEVMSWSSMHLLKRYILTKSITVDFLKPVWTGRRMVAEGKVRERTGEREAVIEGLLYDDAGTLCARSTGTFALFTSEGIRKFGLFDSAMVESFEEVFLGPGGPDTMINEN
ncbi:MAG: PaaI family thioesterase [Spirochaetes bacterium]|nr:PaaI family thioesterase [Spirochaetota bacterium]